MRIVPEVGLDEGNDSVLSVPNVLATTVLDCQYSDWPVERGSISAYAS